MEGDAKLRFKAHKGRIYVFATINYLNENVKVAAPIVPVQRVNDKGVYTWVPDLSCAKGKKFFELMRFDKEFRNRVCGFVKNLGDFLKGSFEDGLPDKLCFNDREKDIQLRYARPVAYIKTGFSTSFSLLLNLSAFKIY